MTKPARPRKSNVMKLDPYPKYKDSGVMWLGKVPAHWPVVPNRGAFTEVNDQNHPDEEMLSVTIGRGVVKQSTLLDDTSMKDGSKIDRSSYKLVQPGDIAYNKMRAWQGAIGVSSYRGIISPAYVVQRPRKGNNPDFLHYLLRTSAFAKEAERNSYGIASDMWSLRPEHFKTIRSCLPPPDEQAAIVRYLDHADEQIQRYIAAKERLIALLEEQRQALVHQAVTRGLDPNVRLKDSGVERLEDVPEHWPLCRLKQASVIQTGITIGQNYGEDELIERPYLRVANVQSGRLDLSRVTTVRVPTAEINRATLKKGDVLMTEGGDIDKLGRGCVWMEDIPDCLHQNHIFAVRPNPAFLKPAFLVALMESFHGRNYFQVTAKQTTNLAATNRTTLGNFPFYLPSVAEQQTILHRVAEQRDALDVAIARTRNQIDLTNEYRTRLIADVVTGQLDVWEAAIELPTPPVEANLPENTVIAQEVLGR